MLLLSWAAVPYHNDISLTFVASSPTNIACMVGYNINTKKGVSFDRNNAQAWQATPTKRDGRPWDKNGFRLFEFLSLPVSS